jgi:hypothetical protein
MNLPRRAPLLLALVLALVLVACTPTLDWREVRPAGSAMLALFPCKPASHARPVALAGRTVSLTLYACTAGETTYALAFADVGEPGQVRAALAELKSSAWANVRAATPVATQPIQLPGMTPNPEATRWRVPGQLPNGQAVQEAGAVFARATMVYQATVIGATLDEQATQTFMEALRAAS